MTSQELGGLARGHQQRLESLSRYHVRPHFCHFCHRILEVAHRRVADVIKKKFCNSSCAAKYNNPLRSS